MHCRSCSSQSGGRQRRNTLECPAIRRGGPLCTSGLVDFFDYCAAAGWRVLGWGRAQQPMGCCAPVSDSEMTCTCRKADGGQQRQHLEEISLLGAFQGPRAMIASPSCPCNSSCKPALRTHAWLLPQLHCLVAAAAAKERRLPDDNALCLTPWAHALLPSGAASTITSTSVARTSEQRKMKKQE